MVGRGENGLKTYKSDFGSDMTVEEKKTYMYRLITDVWAKKPLQLTILQDGKEQQVTARFDGEANGGEVCRENGIWKPAREQNGAPDYAEPCK